MLLLNSKRVAYKAGLVREGPGEGSQTGYNGNKFIQRTHIDIYIESRNRDIRRYTAQHTDSE